MPVRRYFGLPFFERDVVSHTRTVVHLCRLTGEPLPWADGMDPPSPFIGVPADVGDRIMLVNAEDALDKRRSETMEKAVITSIRQVCLGDITQDDLVKVNATRQEYEDRWNDLHPDMPFYSAMVWRIEFEYGWPEDRLS